MATLSIPDEGHVHTDPDKIAHYLSSVGVDYCRWEVVGRVAPDASAEQILAAFAAEVAGLKARGGYVTADVVSITPRTPGLDEMLAKFGREHWHDEDEVRCVIHGRGLFHIRPPEGNVLAVEVEAGDLLRVPRGTWHWFNLCSDREIRAVRLFQDPAGWTPLYTSSRADARYEPVCLGASYLRAG
jgi:1,2-dihydroxy-3-keto-5-methylthiopentene dioxygenase